MANHQLFFVTQSFEGYVSVYVFEMTWTCVEDYGPQRRVINKDYQCPVKTGIWDISKNG